MKVSKMHKQAKPSVALGPQASLSTPAIMPDTCPSQETARIRERAYELYEVGGRKPGHDEQDWLQAEQEILQQQV
jgi:Protein of unknown function (DUF2934)